MHTEADFLELDMYVQGEHRLGLRATRDIPRGEELNFNYGSQFTEELRGGKHNKVKKNM